MLTFCHIYFPNLSLSPCVHTSTNTHCKNKSILLHKQLQLSQLEIEHQYDNHYCINLYLNSSNFSKVFNSNPGINAAS